MGLISDCEKYFQTKNLYEVIGVDKEAKEDEIKRSYRRLSLKHHPDRFNHLSSEEIKASTARFQVLAKVNFVLTDSEKRNIYDSSGVILDDDSLNSDANWMEYWRCLFPEVTLSDINDYLKKYIGSEEELADLKKIYLQYEGNMDSICESMIGFEEERTRSMIQKLIDKKEVPAFDKFVNEPKEKKERRLKKAESEAKEAKKAERARKKAKKDKVDDLVNAIQSRHETEFNSLIDRLAAKYGNEKGDQEELNFSKYPKKRSSKQMK